MIRYSDFIFGYGSLVDINRLKFFLDRDTFQVGDFIICRLQGYRRVWNIAMDNKVDLPGYKYYLDEGTDIRLDAYITFLNVRKCLNTSIIGILFGVSAEELQIVDQRERNYKRIKISNKLYCTKKCNVWLYVGLPNAEQQYQRGLKKENALIAKHYYNIVYNSFTSLGKNYLEDYINTTDYPQVPLHNLTRVTLP